MSEGYYDPQPLYTLERPFVLVGHPASGVAQVGRAMAGRTGLVFNDIERLVEATTGRDRGRLLLDQGLDRLRECEMQALAQALRREPAGIIVMESGLLEDDERRLELSARATTVYLRRPEATLLRLVKQQLERAPGSLPEFIMGAPRDVDELRTFLAGRERALGQLDVIVEVGERHPSAIATELLSSLGRWVELERIGSARTTSTE